MIGQFAPRRIVSHRQNLSRSSRVALLAALLLWGCGSGGGSSAPAYGLQQREVVTTLTFPTGLPRPQPLDVVPAFPNLAFSQPVGITSPGDGTDRLCVVERAGRIHIFPNQPGVTSSTVFLDISDRVSIAGFEEGLLGLAFPPDHAVSGYFYVYYSAASPRRSVLSRFEVSTGDPNLADPGSEAILLEVDQPFGNHNGGMLAFGPDGMLYVALGDGGSGGDPLGHGQNLTTYLGSLLRIQPQDIGGYTVPADNPFVGAGGGVKEEIWAYGLRNPWRFSFDRDTGDLWLGDVGQNAREEIDRVASGDNLGWRIYEGTIPFDNPLDLPPTDFTAPVLDYPHTEGNSVTGGYVYRGPTLTSLQGAYVYGDFGSGRIWALVHDGSQAISNVQVASVSQPSSFGEAEDGELFVVSFGGQVYRFEESGGGGPPPPFPQLLSETGIFRDLATLEPEAGIIEYGVNVPFWSDDALKRRWIALPGIATIDFDPTGAWQLPVGAALIKHFELPLRAGDPSSASRLETRVLLHEVGGWAGYTYRWDDAGADATLLAGAESQDYVIEDPSAPGGTRIQEWLFPSQAQCLECHTGAAERVLGLKTRQLNRSFHYPTIADNQLRAWNHIGLFSTDVGLASSYESFAEAPSGDADNDARTYLDVNCSFCHRPDHPSPAAMDLRFDTPTGAMNVVGVPPVAGDLGIPGALLLDPGSKETSIIWERMRRLDAFRMPPLGSTRVDELGVEIVGEWIDSGP